MCEQELKEIPYEPRLLSWSVGWSVCRSVSSFFKIRTSFFLCFALLPHRPGLAGCVFGLVSSFTAHAAGY